MAKLPNKHVRDTQDKSTLEERKWKLILSERIREELAMRIVIFQSHGSNKKLQQERHWHRLLFISSRVFNHACFGSFRLQPGKRRKPMVASLFVDSFIPRRHIITLLPRNRFQPNFGPANKAYLGSLELFFLSAFPNHRKRVPKMIRFNLLDDLGFPKIQCRTSSFIRCFHEKCPIDRRHLRSNTWSISKSPKRTAMSHIRIEESNGRSHYTLGPW